MGSSLLRAGRLVISILTAVVLLAGCSARKSVPEKPETTREVVATPSVTAERDVDGQPAATYTRYPTYTPYPTFTPLPTATVTVTPLPAADPTSTRAAAPANAPTEMPTQTATRPPAQSATRKPAPPPAVSSVDLVRGQDKDPAPPFTILVSSVRAGEDGYKITGSVRNDGSEIYEGIGVIGTFYGEGGLWYGPLDAHCPCLFLEPGAECPFSLDVLPGNYVEYVLHPEGQPVEFREPASLGLSGLHLANDGIGNVRITGTATNDNPFTVRNVTIIGSLLDASGKIVSLGSTFLAGEIAPGASVPFDLRIVYEPYAHHVLFVQAVRN